MFIINKEPIIEIFIKYSDEQIDNLPLFPVVYLFKQTSSKELFKYQLKYDLGLSYLIAEEQKYLDKYVWTPFISNDIFNLLIKQSCFNILSNFTSKCRPFGALEITNKIVKIVNDESSSLLNSYYNLR